MVMNKNDLNRAFSPKLKQRKSLRNAVSVSSRDGTSSSNVKVLVRIRPLNEREQQQNLRIVVQPINDRLLIFDPKEDSDLHFFHDVKQKNRDITKKQNKHAQFSFDRVFDAYATNENVYEESIKDIISSLLQGYNCSVFVYGTTGAGKTYTMLGSKDNPGISFLTMKELYDQINRLESPADISLGVCYLEVYNENVHDLINPSGPLHLRDDGNRVMVAGTNILKVENADQLFDMLEKGNRNRTQHPTDANSESSRSHAVFQVYLRMTEKLSGEVRRVKLSMIDLAGSERGTSTGCKGIRFKEGSNINKSLLALGNCINSLADGRRHIPYRDSKLTRLLKDSLGINCKTVMIANVAPSVKSYEDTYNTLKYAARAKEIKSALSKNIVKVESDITYYVRLTDEMKKENEILKKEIELMKVAKGNSETSEMDPKYVTKLDEIYAEKTKLHKELLNLESLEKILQWRINHKQAVAGQLTNNTIENEETKGLGRVEQSVHQLKAQELSLNSERENIWNKLMKNEEKLNLVLKELEDTNKKNNYETHIELKQQKLENLRLEIQVTHLQKLYSLIDKHFETVNYSNSKMYKTLSRYYMVIRGLNKLTNEMESEYQDIVRMVAGSMKGVTWKDEKYVALGVAKIHPYMNLSFTRQIKEISPPNQISARGTENIGSSVIEETVSNEQANTDINSTFVFPLPKQEANTNVISKPVNGVTRGITYLTGYRMPKYNRYSANKENHVPVINTMLPPLRMDRTVLAPKHNQVLTKTPQSASKVDIISSKKTKDRQRSSSTYLLTTPSLKRLGHQKMKRPTPISVKSIERYIASNK